MKADPVLRFQNLLLTGLITAGAAASSAVGQAGFTVEKLQTAWSQGTLGACLAGGALSGIIGYLYNRLASRHDEQNASKPVTHEETGPNGHLTRLSAHTIRCLVDRFAAITRGDSPSAALSFTAFHVADVWIELMQGEDEVIRRTASGHRLADLITSHTSGRNLGHLLSAGEWTAFICHVFSQPGAPELPEELAVELGDYLHSHFDREFFEQAKHAAGRDPVTFAALQLHILGALRAGGQAQQSELAEMREMLASSNRRIVAGFGPAESAALGNDLAALGADIALLRADLDELPKRIADAVIASFDARLRRIETAAGHAAWWARKSVQFAAAILLGLGLLGAHQWWRARQQDEQGGKLDRIVVAQEQQAPVLAGIRETSQQVMFKTDEVAAKTQRVEEKAEHIMQTTRQVTDELQRLRDQVAALSSQIAVTQTAGETPRAVVAAVTTQLQASEKPNAAGAFVAAEEDAARKLGLSIAQLREQIPQAKDNAAERLRLASALAELGTPREGAGEEEAKLRAVTAETARKERLQALRDLASAERVARQYESSADFLRQAEALTDRARDDLEWAEVRDDLSMLQAARNRYREAGETIREILPIMEARVGPEAPNVLEIRSRLAFLHMLQGDYENAEKQLTELLPIQRRILGENDRKTLINRGNLLTYQLLAGKRDEVAAALPALLADVHRVLGPKDPTTLKCRGLEHLLLGNGDYAAITSKLRPLVADLTEILGPEAWGTLFRRRELVGMEFKLLEAEATDPPKRATVAAQAKLEKELRDILAACERQFGPDDLETISARRDLAAIAAGQSRFDEARQLLDGVIDTRTRILGPTAPATLEARWDLGMLHRDQGLDEKAADTFREVIAAWEKAHGPAHRKTLESRVLFAQFLSSRSKHEEVEEQLRAMLSTLEPIKEAKSPDMLELRDELCRVLFEQRKHAEAEMELKQFLPLLREAVGPENRRTFMAWENLAMVIHRQRRYADAETEYRSLTASLTKALGAEHEKTLEIQYETSRCMLTRDQPGAIKLAEQTLKTAQKSPKKHGPLIANLRKALVNWKKLPSKPMPPFSPILLNEPTLPAPARQAPGR